LFAHQTKYTADLPMRFAEDLTWLHAQEITQSGDSGQRPKWAKEPADQPLVLTLLIVLILKLSNQNRIPTELRRSSTRSNTLSHLQRWGDQQNLAARMRKSWCTWPII